MSAASPPGARCAGSAADSGTDGGCRASRLPSDADQLVQVVVVVEVVVVVI
jgi:hypothetical protein